MTNTSVIEGTRINVIVESEGLSSNPVTSLLRRRIQLEFGHMIRPSITADTTAKNGETNNNYHTSPGLHDSVIMI